MGGPNPGSLFEFSTGDDDGGGLEVEDVTQPRAAPLIGDFYGVPVTDSEGNWSIVTGADAAATESHLVARPKKNGDPEAPPKPPPAVPSSRPKVGDAVCEAVERAREERRDAAPPKPPPVVEEPEDDFIVEGLDKVLFPARLFDPFFSLGLTIHEQSLHVLSVAKDGQGDRMGVLVGWRAVSLGDTQAPLTSLQMLINQLTAARQTGTKLAVWFEGDAQE